MSLSRWFRSRPARGLTVFELGVMLFATALIAGGVAWASSGTADRDRTEQAFRSAQLIRTAAESWRREHTQGCPTVSVLKHEAYLEPEAAGHDPWGNRFRLSCSGDRVTVSSLGRDGKANTADDVRVPEVSG
jgi:hypothetical protein